MHSKQTRSIQERADFDGLFWWGKSKVWSIVKWVLNGRRRTEVAQNKQSCFYCAWNQLCPLQYYDQKRIYFDFLKIPTCAVVWLRPWWFSTSYPLTQLRLNQFEEMESPNQVGLVKDINRIGNPWVFSAMTMNIFWNTSCFALFTVFEIFYMLSFSLRSLRRLNSFAKRRNSSERPMKEKPRNRPRVPPNSATKKEGE